MGTNVAKALGLHMACLEPRGDRFPLIFRYAGERHQAPLKTDNAHDAGQIAQRIERKSDLLAQGDICLPENADIVSFLLGEQPKSKPSSRLRAIYQEYQEARQSLEVTSLCTIKIHLAHVLEAFGPRTRLS